MSRALASGYYWKRPFKPHPLPTQPPAPQSWPPPLDLLLASWKCLPRRTIHPAQPTKVPPSLLPPSQRRAPHWSWQSCMGAEVEVLRVKWVFRMAPPSGLGSMAAEPGRRERHWRGGGRHRGWKGGIDDVLRSFRRGVGCPRGHPLDTTTCSSSAAMDGVSPPSPLPPRAFALPLFLRLLRPCLRQSTAQGSVEEEEEQEEQGELFCILGG